MHGAGVVRTSRERHPRRRQERYTNIVHAAVFLDNGIRLECNIYRFYACSLGLVTCENYFILEDCFCEQAVSDIASRMVGICTLGPMMDNGSQGAWSRATIQRRVTRQWSSRLADRFSATTKLSSIPSSSLECESKSSGICGDNKPLSKGEIPCPTYANNENEHVVKLRS